jgi:DNA polymerase III epsilon subunit family exonuclease
MREIEFVALDCETTGLDSERDNIIELGAVKFSINENLDSFDSLFHSPTRIPQFVERLTGIQNADLEGAPKFEEKREEFQKFCGEKILVGHNLKFDLDFLAASDLDLSSNSVFDTFRIAGLILPRGESLALENLSQKFGITHDDAHRALADAEATRDLLQVFVQIAKSFSQEKWKNILSLNGEGWVKNFAELVQNPEFKSKQYEAEGSQATEVRQEVVERLVTKFQDGEGLLEITASSADIFAASKKLEKPTAIFFANSFEVREFGSAGIFAPKNYVDPTKLDNFLSRELSETELIFAAKLILHEGSTFHDINLTRAECLLFDFIAAEEQTKELPEFFVSDHASLPVLANAPHLKIVADAISLPENIARANSLILDFPTLEELAQPNLEKLQIWWGVLGLLIREAAPRFGKVNLSEVTSLSHFAKAIEIGKSFLEVVEETLPPKVTMALRKFLTLDPEFRSVIRSNAMGEITLVIEPLKIVLPENSNSIFLDAAAEAGDDFRFAKKTLQLPEGCATEKFEASGELPRFLVADDTPEPASPQFFPAVEKFLLKELPQLGGITAVVFPNRMDAGNFAERAMAEFSFPTFFRKLPTAEKLAELEKAVVILTTGSKVFPSRLNNFVSVKLPFIVRDDADWQTETLPATVLRFKKMWANFADSDVAEKFLALDPRLLHKAYGQDFLAAIPQEFESISISKQ